VTIVNNPYSANCNPRLNLSVAQVSRDEGIGLQTLYNWRNHAREQGQPMPTNNHTPDNWTSDTKLATVIETAALSESELSEYCRIHLRILQPKPF